MTVLQELIQKLESFKKELKEKYDGDPLVTLGFSVAINEANTLLEMERNILEECAMNFCNYTMDCIEENKEPNSEEYFKKYYDEKLKK